MVATGVAAIDSTVVATAVPSIVGDLGGFTEFPWLFSIYLLTSAVTVPVYSKIADMRGRKAVILVGLAVFLAGSILCGLAWDMPSLIVARAVQGIGAGAILPMAITIIGDIYSVEERARVQGYVASVWGLASVVGPTLGGVFSQFDIWRGIFFLNIPLCLLAGFLLVRNFHERFERHPHRLDVPGAVLLTAGLTALLLAVLEGGSAWAWDSAPSFALFGGGAALLVAFGFVERRAAEPIFPFAVLRERVVLAAVIIGVWVGAVLISLTAFVPTYLQVGLGLPPILAGLALATLTLGWPLLATFSGRFYLRIGFRSTTYIGAALVLVGTVVLAVFGPTPSLVIVASACFVVGAGFGLSAVPSLVAAQASVEWGQRGAVTGANMFSRSIGQAVGAAVFGAVANGIISSNGGETDPGAVIAGSSAVFVGTALVAVLLMVSAALLPAKPRLVE